MKTRRWYHLKHEKLGFYVGVAPGATIWSKRSYWGARYTDPDVARKVARDAMAGWKDCFDGLSVVRVRRLIKRPVRPAGPADLKERER